MPVKTGIYRNHDRDLFQRRLVTPYGRLPNVTLDAL